MAENPLDNSQGSKKVDSEGNPGSTFISALNDIEAEQDLKDPHDTREEDNQHLEHFHKMEFYKTSGRTPPRGYAAPKFDRHRQLIYLEKLANTGNQTLACAYTPVTRKTILIHRKANRWFREACQDAMTAYGDLAEAEAIRRAVKGVKKPVFQKGMLVGHERVYSDHLLALILKAKKAEYKDKLAVDATVSGGVLIVPTPAKDSKEWEERYGHLRRPGTVEDQTKIDTKEEIKDEGKKVKVQTIGRG